MKTMIMVAPNGAHKTKADHPALPISAPELADEAAACVEVGAMAIHLHVRNDKGAHVLDAGRYVEALEAVRARVGDRMIIQITTEAVGIYSAAEQMACVRAVKPQAVSVALKEIVPDGQDIDEAQQFFAWMQAEQISPQFILYEADEVARLFRLQAQGVIPFKVPFLLFVLGRYALDQQSDPLDLDPFLKALGEHRANWAMCAFGRREAECAVYAAGKGGHVRIGFENNLLLPDGSLAPTNSALVAVTKKMLAQKGHLVMTPAEAVEILTTSLR